MTDLRAAAQQALEALELGYDAVKAEADQYHAAMAGYRPHKHKQMDADVQQVAAAITALRAALEQPVQPRSDYRDWDYQDQLDAEEQKAEQAQPGQEPVAWLAYTEDGKSAYVTDNPTDLIGACRALPLYTAPPTAQPAVPQWIACSERMPDVSQDCVVVVLGVVMPAEWIDQKFITWRSYNHPDGADEINDITHWMPLPEPPTGGKHD